MSTANITENKKNGFSPYTDNAIAGEDFVVVAGDTRLSSGYSILSRDVSKLHKLTNQCYLASAGCLTDVTTLQKNLDAKIHMYELNHNGTMTSTSIAQMLSVALFQRRLFPYYSFNLLAGLDEEGKGAIYSYDAVGSYEKLKYGAQGSSNSAMTAALDNMVAHKNRNDPKIPITLQDAIDIVKDVCLSATEVDIYSGDSVEIAIITKEGIREERFALRRD